MGIIRNSVNFPTAILEPKHHNVACRLCIVNANLPGVLGRITTTLGEGGVNIVQQLNTSKGDIAYNVVDVEELPDDPRQLQMALSEVEGILSSRMIVGLPGFGYHTTMMGDSMNYYDAA